MVMKNLPVLNVLGLNFEKLGMGAETLVCQLYLQGRSCHDR